MCSAGACGDAAPREGGLVPGAEGKAEHSRASAPHGGLPASVGPWRLRDLPAALVRFQRMASIINGCSLHVFFGLLFSSTRMRSRTIARLNRRGSSGSTVPSTTAFKTSTAPKVSSHQSASTSTKVSNWKTV